LVSPYESNNVELSLFFSDGGTRFGSSVFHTKNDIFSTERHIFGALMSGSEERIGRIANYYSKIGVAAIQIEGGTLSIGDTIRIKGSTTDFTQAIESMEIDRKPVASASKGQSIGVKVRDRVRPNDIVFKL